MTDANTVIDIVVSDQNMLNIQPYPIAPPRQQLMSERGKSCIFIDTPENAVIVAKENKKINQASKTQVYSHNKLHNF